MSRIAKKAGLLGGLLLMLCVPSAAVPALADPVPPGPGSGLVPSYLGAPATAHPIPGRPIPANPAMELPGYAGMHADSYDSNTYPFAGPLGRDPRVTSSAKSGFPLPGLCSSLGYARSVGLLIGQCTSGSTLRLRLMDPRTMADLATLDLPMRPSTVDAIYHLDLDALFSDTSGGAYFYLDAQDRVVLADAAGHIRRITAAKDAQGAWRLTVTGDWDLTGAVPHACPTWTDPNPSGECDPITAVGPDWQGRIWWASRHGRIGTLNPATGVVKTLPSLGEDLENSFAAAETGVAIVTDHALYLLRAGPDGTPTIVWRRAYDRGTARKTGQIDQGSGTTPSFLGTKYVAITDNAAPRMHVNVYRRADGRLVCSRPVFAAGASATENAMIAYGNSLIVENNSGYTNFLPLPPGGSVPGGVTRVDVRADGSGCRTVWQSAERSPSVVPKASVASGLVYLYAKEPRADLIDAWYLTAVDFRTGRTAYKVLAGTGKWFDNDWAPITLGPDGTAYVGVVGGLVAIRDR